MVGFINALHKVKTERAETRCNGERAPFGVEPDKEPVRGKPEGIVPAADMSSKKFKLKKAGALLPPARKASGTASV